MIVITSSPVFPTDRGSERLVSRSSGSLGRRHPESVVEVIGEWGILRLTGSYICF